MEMGSSREEIARSGRQWMAPAKALKACTTMALGWESYAASRHVGRDVHPSREQSQCRLWRVKQLQRIAIHEMCIRHAHARTP